MRAAKAVLGTLIAIAALYGFGRFFVGQLGQGEARPGAQGIVFGPPPGFQIEQGGELGRQQAARRLAAALARQPRTDKLGIHFRSGGFELYWLVVQHDPKGPQILELAAGPTGTRLATFYVGDLAARLAWAELHGTFDAPGTRAGESRNLYH